MSWRVGKVGLIDDVKNVADLYYMSFDNEETKQKCFEIAVNCINNFLDARNSKPQFVKNLSFNWEYSFVSFGRSERDKRCTNPSKIEKLIEALFTRMGVGYKDFKCDRDILTEEDIMQSQLRFKFEVKGILCNDYSVFFTELKKMPKRDRE